MNEDGKTITSDKAKKLFKISSRNIVDIMTMIKKIFRK